MKIMVPLLTFGFLTPDELSALSGSSACVSRQQGRIWGEPDTWWTVIALFSPTIENSEVFLSCLKAERSSFLQTTSLSLEV
jgi:hypothetical protein